MAIKTVYIDGETFRYNKVNELVSMVGTHINGVRSELQNEIWKRDREIVQLRDQATSRHEMRINAMMQSQEEMGRALAKLSDNTSHSMRMYLEEVNRGRVLSVFPSRSPADKTFAHAMNYASGNPFTGDKK